MPRADHQRRLSENRFPVGAILIVAFVLPLVVYAEPIWNVVRSYVSTDFRDTVARRQMHRNVERLSSPDRSTRLDAVRYFAWIAARDPDGVVVPTLVSLLDDPHWIVRESAVDALANLRATGAVGSIERMLRDPQERVRKAAEKALEELRVP